MYLLQVKKWGELEYTTLLSFTLSQLQKAEYKYSQLSTDYVLEKRLVKLMDGKITVIHYELKA